MKGIAVHRQMNRSSEEGDVEMNGLVSLEFKILGEAT